MSLLLLKKKIQDRKKELFDVGVDADNNLDTMDSHAFYRGEIELNRVLKWIDELEKEEPSHHYECDHDGPFLLRGWSGRSEKEIRERIEEINDRLLSDDYKESALILLMRRKELNWVLSKEKDEATKK